MKFVNQVEENDAMSVEETEADPLAPLVRGRTTRPGADFVSGAVIGELIGLDHDGRTPLVSYPGQPGSDAVTAHAVVELHAHHVGRQVVLLFHDAVPIIMGVLRESGRPLAEQATQVEIDVDGERVVVTGRRQVVLRCGKASITLTKEGKVLIDGTYLSSHSTGVNRIKGGSVQIN